MDLPEDIRIQDNELIEWMYKVKQHLDGIDRTIGHLRDIVVQHRDNQNVMIEGFKQVIERMDGMENYLSNSLKRKEAYVNKKTKGYKYE